MCEVGCVWLREHESVCVCDRVCMYERECLYMSEKKVCVGVCVRKSECVCDRVCMHERECVCEREHVTVKYIIDRYTPGWHLQHLQHLYIYIDS